MSWVKDAIVVTAATAATAAIEAIEAIAASKTEVAAEECIKLSQSIITTLL